MPSVAIFGFRRGPHVPGHIHTSILGDQTAQTAFIASPARDKLAQPGCLQCTMYEDSFLREPGLGEMIIIVVGTEVPRRPGETNQHLCGSHLE